MAGGEEYVAYKMHVSSKVNLNIKTVYKSGNNIKMQNLKCKKIIINNFKCA